MPGPAAVTNGNTSRRYDRRLAEILAHATDVFCDKGYAAASIRDISRASGSSLAGLYYYFRSKEELLYQIQKDAFETLLARLEQRLAKLDDPNERVRALVHNHISYFLEHRKGMKVLSHEADALKGPHQAEIAALKRRYYHACVEVVAQLRAVPSRQGQPNPAARGLKRLNARLAVLSLFGMMNWIYTWYRPEVDPGAAALADHMAGIFLNGVLHNETWKEQSNERNRIRPTGRSRKAARAGTGALSRRGGRGRAGTGRPAGQHVHV